MEAMRWELDGIQPTSICSEACPIGEVRNHQVRNKQHNELLEYLISIFEV